MTSQNVLMILVAIACAGYFVSKVISFRSRSAQASTDAERRRFRIEKLNFGLWALGMVVGTVWITSELALGDHSITRLLRFATIGLGAAVALTSAMIGWMEGRS